MAGCDSVTTSSKRRERPLSLPVLPGSDGSRRIRPSRNGPRRALVLGAVHVLIAAHIAWWLWTGRTITPVEPSESMQTLEMGLVNAGFLFFAAAILATLVFGRFFCGWGCHLVALQDACGWLMKKLGMRPHPFRSRLLALAPLALALYMFVWPTVKRAVVAPAVESWWPTVRADLGINVFPADGFTLHLTTEGFWETFAPPLIAIPFLLVCGFATVYFLGAKGFCTYGCPYGGIFAPVDQLSPGRIVVDPERCHQCGHCTATCTSNVRVHDEIREYGMVVDSGCMKCLDCVSVCPNDALSFRFARPAVLKGAPKTARPKRGYDTTIAEDLALVAAFVGIFLATRGAYGVIPMLFAVGIAGCGTFLAWKAYRLVRTPNVRLGTFQLRLRGKLTTSGAVFAALVTLAAALVGHTGYVNYHRWLGDLAYARLGLSKEALLNPATPPLSREALDLARTGLAHYRSSFFWGDGGAGLAPQAQSELRAALLALALGEHDTSEALLRRVWERWGPADELVADLGRVILAGSHGAEGGSVIALYERALAERPDFWSVREHYAGLMAGSGLAQQAMAEAESALARIPAEKWTRRAHARTQLTLGRLQAISGRPRDALTSLRRAAEVAPDDATVRENLAAAILQIEGDVDAALVEARAALQLARLNHALRFQVGLLELQAGRTAEAVREFEELLQREPDSAARRAAIATALRQAGHEAEAARFEAEASR